MMRPLGARGSVSGPLGAIPASLGVDWWLAGGISASDVAGAWAAKGAASLAASYLRLAGDQGNANVDPAVVGGVAPTWDAVNGWFFSGILPYLLTGITPANGWSAIVKFSDVTNGGAAFGGIGVGSSSFGIRPNRNGAVVQYWQGEVANNVSGPLVSGTAAISGQFEVSADVTRSVV